MSNIEASALLLGAGIALVSSLVTTILASLFTYWLSIRNRRREKIARLNYLIGETAVDLNDNHDTQELVKFWQKQKKVLDIFVSTGDDNDIDGLTGMLESLSRKLKDLEELRNSLQSEIDMSKINKTPDTDNG